MPRHLTFAFALLVLPSCLHGGAELTQTDTGSAAPHAAGVHSNDAQQLFVAGETALRTGDLTTAERDFREVVAKNPRSAGAYANLGVIAMRRRQWSQALALLKRAEQLAPAVAGIRLNIGLVYFRQNNFKEAIAPFASVLRDQPGSSQARYL